MYVAFVLKTIFGFLMPVSFTYSANNDLAFSGSKSYPFWLLKLGMPLGMIPLVAGIPMLFRKYVIIFALSKP